MTKQSTLKFDNPNLVQSFDSFLCDLLPIECVKIKTLTTFHFSIITKVILNTATDIFGYQFFFTDSAQRLVITCNPFPTLSLPILTFLSYLCLFRNFKEGKPRLNISYKILFYLFTTILILTLQLNSFHNTCFHPETIHILLQHGSNQ